MSALVFGKLPAHGDFVSRGLTAELRTRLDAWLSAAMVEARAAYADFDDRFDRATPWRAEGDGVSGAIAASQDGAGRRFPLLVLARGDAARCEDLLYAAIGESWTVDRLAEEAGEAPDVLPTAWRGYAGTRDGAMPADLLTAMLA